MAIALIHWDVKAVGTKVLEFWLRLEVSLRLITGPEDGAVVLTMPDSEVVGGGVVEGPTVALVLPGRAVEPVWREDDSDDDDDLLRVRGVPASLVLDDEDDLLRVRGVPASLVLVLLLVWVSVLVLAGASEQVYRVEKLKGWYTYRDEGHLGLARGQWLSLCRSHRSSGTARCRAP